jgi:predicted ABC-type ATPase
MAAPTFYVVAGPNGSGKTTFALNDPALKSIPFINADIEAQRLSPGSPAKAALAAGGTTLSNIAREISAGAVFAFETTLSGNSTLKIMHRALAAGYVIDLSYLCLHSPQINVGRVAMRVAAGGHHVPEMDVVRRYSRSLRNLPAALALADRGRVFDNTRKSKPRLILEVRERSILFLHYELPEWFRNAFALANISEPADRQIENQLRNARGRQR